jgi:small subunit ribosomal protein S9
MAKAETTKQVKSSSFTYAVGRRREAVARVRVYNPQSTTVTVFENEYKVGDLVINGKQAAEYFRFKPYAPKYKKLFELTDTLGKYFISVKVVGGGIEGQLEAMLHGIARAYDKIDTEKYHTLLKENGYLTRDPRTRERRKVGTGGKARRQKQSPKR